jgi:gluconolactonase
MHAEYELIDDRFRQLIVPIAGLERLYSGCLWAEGPVYFADGDFLLFSDIPNNRMLRWVEGLGAAVYRQPSNFSNGNSRDRQGRLVTCEHGGRRVTRTEADGSISVLAESYRGKRLNSPNDLVVKSDGSLWFTDPTYGILSDYEGHRAKSELDGCYVFRCFPESGEIEVVADDFVKPNGLAFSPEEDRLYVSDSGASHEADGPHHIRVFDVVNGRKLVKGRIFAAVSPAVPDGFRLDSFGNLWTSAGDGVHCYSPKGELLGKILVPEPVANLVFGGPKRNRLFIAATTSLYAIYTAVTGAQTP